MNQEQADLSTAFRLGWKIALQLHDVERRPGDLTPEIHDLLAEIADGSLTLVDSVAETTRDTADEVVQDEQARTMGPRMAVERSMAIRLLPPPPR